MKRSRLKRKTPLDRKSELKATEQPPKPRKPLVRRTSLRKPERALAQAQARRDEPGRAEWVAAHSGRCANCGRRGPLQRHHAVLEQKIRRAGGDPYDLRWAIELGRYCDCHELHHSYGVNDRRLEFRVVPGVAVRLAIELLGPGAAADYFRRRYRDAPDLIYNEGSSDGRE